MSSLFAGTGSFQVYVEGEPWICSKTMI